MKYLLTLVLFLVAATPVYASEVTGTLTTGVSTGSGVNGTVVVAPSASPVAGTYTGTQNITLTASGSDSIHFFLNTLNLDNELTCSTGTTYTSAVEVTGSGLLRAIACYGSTASSLASFSYVIESVSTPAPPSGGGGGGGGGFIPTTPSTSIYDFNGDGIIDILDFNILMVNWGSTSATNAMGDTDGNGTVDIFDFNSFMINWV